MDCWPPDEHLDVRWKARRVRPVSVVMLHATRGRTTMERQYEATKSWFTSLSNDRGGWGAAASAVISHRGQVCWFMSDDYYPTWSAGVHDPIAISFELAQPAWQEPFTPACLERAAAETARKCRRYGIPPLRIPFLDAANSQAPGIASHDASANGRRYNKTDPGPLFPWDWFLRRVREHLSAAEEDTMAIRHNQRAEWFSGRTLRPGPDGTMQAASDFALPPGAQAVQMEIMLDPARSPQGGELLFFDGGTNGERGYAGRVLARAGGYGEVYVRLDGGGACRFRVLEGVWVQAITCLRYWP